jgi:hypothetical protein
MEKMNRSDRRIAAASSNTQETKRENEWYR